MPQLQKLWNMKKHTKYWSCKVNLEMSNLVWSMSVCHTVWLMSYNHRPWNVIYRPTYLIPTHIPTFLHPKLTWVPSFASLLRWGFPQNLLAADDERESFVGQRERGEKLSFLRFWLQCHRQTWGKISFETHPHQQWLKKSRMMTQGMIIQRWWWYLIFYKLYWWLFLVL